jgi:hypothetical protein
MRPILARLFAALMILWALGLAVAFALLLPVA